MGSIIIEFRRMSRILTDNICHNNTTATKTSSKSEARMRSMDAEDQCAQATRLAHAHTCHTAHTALHAFAFSSYVFVLPDKNVSRRRSNPARVF